MKLSELFSVGLRSNGLHADYLAETPETDSAALARKPAAGQGAFEFDEDEHPRDESGQFTSKGAPSAEETAKEDKPPLPDGKVRMRHARNIIDGGEFSEVTGRIHPAGEWFPVHGMSAGKKKEKPAKPTAETGVKPVANEDGKKKPVAKVPTAEDLAHEQRKHEFRQEYDLVKAGPISEIVWFGDHARVPDGTKGTKSWQAWATQQPPERIQHVLEVAKRLAMDQRATEIDANPDLLKDPFSDNVDTKEAALAYLESQHDSDRTDFMFKRAELKKYPEIGRAYNWVQNALEDATGEQKWEAVKRINEAMREPMHGSSTHSATFKDWFGDWKNNPKEASKVVAEDGSPLIVYHGTGKEISEFNKDSVKSNFHQSFGFHFAKSPDEAARYAPDMESGEAEGGNVLPVYLDIRNPLKIHSKTQGASMTADFDRAEIIHKIVESRKTKKPYDGVIVTSDDGSANYIVFEPNQIKSATGNSGAFSKSDNRITLAVTARLRETRKPPTPDELAKWEAETLGAYLAAVEVTKKLPDAGRAALSRRPGRVDVSAYLRAVSAGLSHQVADSYMRGGAESALDTLQYEQR